MTQLSITQAIDRFIELTKLLPDFEMKMNGYKYIHHKKHNQFSFISNRVYEVNVPIKSSTISKIARLIPTPIFYELINNMEAKYLLMVLQEEKICAAIDKFIDLIRKLNSDFSFEIKGYSITYNKLVDNLTVNNFTFSAKIDVLLDKIIYEKSFPSYVFYELIDMLNEMLLSKETEFEQRYLQFRERVKQHTPFDCKMKYENAWFDLIIVDDTVTVAADTTRESYTLTLLRELHHNPFVNAIIDTVLVMKDKRNNWSSIIAMLHAKLSAGNTAFNIELYNFAIFLRSINDYNIVVDKVTFDNKNLIINELDYYYFFKNAESFGNTVDTIKKYMIFLEVDMVQWHTVLPRNYIPTFQNHLN